LAKFLRKSATTVSMPYLVQILLPLYDNHGVQFASAVYGKVRSELTDRFGGLTAYTRAPAEGLWGTGHEVKRDDIVVLELMAPALDPGWWHAYRKQLEKLFRQDQIVVRAQAYEAL
jgi:hypothetical protein